MYSIGEQLRRARLEKGVSLEEAYKKTKIHTHVLEALEQDRAHNFLSLIYIKGFLRTYAQYLGLNSEKLIKEYTDSQKQQVSPSEVVVEKENKRWRQFRPALIIRTVLGLVLFVALIFYFHFVFKRIFHQPPKAEVPKVSVKIAPAPQIQELVLEVRTLNDCWLRVKADEEIIFQKTLSKGRVEKWRAKDKIELRIGKPEALSVHLNGKPIDLKKAKVKRTLIVTHKGIAGK